MQECGGPLSDGPICPTLFFFSFFLWFTCWNYYRVICSSPCILPIACFSTAHTIYSSRCKAAAAIVYFLLKGGGGRHTFQSDTKLPTNRRYNVIHRILSSFRWEKVSSHMCKMISFSVFHNLFPKYFGKSLFLKCWWNWFTRKRNTFCGSSNLHWKVIM